MEAKGFSEQELNRITERVAACLPDMAQPTGPALTEHQSSLQEALTSGLRRQQELLKHIGDLAEQEQAVLSEHLEPENASSRRT